MHIDKSCIIHKNIGKRIADIVLHKGSLNTAVTGESVFEKIFLFHGINEKHIIIKKDEMLWQSFYSVKIQFYRIKIKGKYLQLEERPPLAPVRGGIDYQFLYGASSGISYF